MGNCMDAKRGEYRLNSEDLDEKYNAETKGTKSRNRQIEKYMKNVEHEDNQIMKLLLLGAGSSGKSTLFRQIECIHGDNSGDNPAFNDIDRFFVNIASMKRTIRLNCINGLVKLVQQSDILSKPPHNHTECAIDFKDPHNEKAIQLLLAFATKNIDHQRERDFEDTEQLASLAESMDFLWHLEGIKETFRHRQYFSLIENLDHFLSKISTIMDETHGDAYSPSIEDILNARMKTTGIVERVYFIQQKQFNIFDVGGQRNERRKWIRLFDTVNGLIFVAALNHYCCVLFEDESINAMTESLQLFEEICNAKWFSSRHTQFILFLNKNDLFIQRLKVDKIALSNNEGFKDKYKGPNYGDKDDDQFQSEHDKDEWFDQCYVAALEFIKTEYLKRNRNPRITSIFTHVTTATNKSNIQRVFDDVRIGIISQSLINSGFTHVDAHEVALSMELDDD